MAELDFSHKVSEIPRGESLPAPIEKKEHIETSHIPDFQGTLNRYAEDTNWMSALGSSVAAKSSAAIASKLGGELGKNPQGELPPAFTEFDKNMRASYETQAASTLGLEAQKLITKSNLELAASPRLDADMISKTQKSNIEGLEKIFSMAPDSLRPQMESHYGSVMIDQNATLITRMIGEQKQDRKEKLELSSKVNAENSHGLALSGNDKGAEAAMNSSIAEARASAARHDITLEQAKVIEDTARQSLLSGKITRIALEAEKNKKLPEFYKILAENPAQFGISDKDHHVIISNVTNYMNAQSSLRNQDQQLKIAEFQNRIAEDPTSISGSEMIDLQNNLTPLQFQKVKLDLFNARNKENKKNAATASAMNNFTNFETFSQNSSEDNFNVLEKLSNQKIEEAAKRGIKLSLPEAQMQIAATAAGPIKGYMDILNTKAASGNGIMMQEVSAAIDYISNANSGQNLKGITEDTISAVAKFNALSASTDPVTAALTAKEIVYNKTSAQNIANESGWKNHLKNNISKGQTNASFALSQANIKPNSLVDVGLLSEYALQKYETYYKLNNEDIDTAKKLLREDIAKTFGETSINDRSEYAMFPIESYFNLPDGSHPFIQNDIAIQINKRLSGTKELYDQGKNDFYWEVNPFTDLESALAAKSKLDQLDYNDIHNKEEISNLDRYINDVYRKPYGLTKNQIEKSGAEKTLNVFEHNKTNKVTQHFRDGHTKEYEVVIQADPSLGVSRTGDVNNPVSGWYNVALRAGKSITPLVLADPYSGPARYYPNRNKIINDYLSLHPHFMLDTELQNLIKQSTFMSLSKS